MIYYEVGKKVVGYWGAMWPYSYGKMCEVDVENMKFSVQWADGSKYHGRISDVFYEEVRACGVGVYFASGDEPDHWFEKEEAA
jgi:hypothetical protein